MTAPTSICLLGFGEVGTVLADDLSAVGGLEIVAWDLAFAHAGSAPSRRLAARPGIRAATGPAAAAEGCDLVISAVTAAQDLAAAVSVLPGLASGTWFLDLNSVSPATKRQVADTVTDAGGRYVEAAILAPIEPERIRSPILVGGPHARAFLAPAAELGFEGIAFCADDIGRAAATKLCRSVVVKGLEALMTEALAAARFYGVEDAVLASLRDLVSAGDWRESAHYMIGRSLRHGARRAEEMREAASTVAGAGIEPLMSAACAERQAQAASIGSAADELAATLDAILAAPSGLTAMEHAKRC